MIARKGHPLESGKNLSFSQLIGYPLVTPAQVRPSHKLFKTVTESASGQLDPHIICSDFPTLIGVLICSDSLLVSATFNCEDELRQGTLVELDITHPALKTELGVIEIDKRSRSPAAQEFIDILTKGLTA